MKEPVEILRDGKHSLVVKNASGTTTYDGRGVSDLYRLLTESPDTLRDADVADKVVGKGAAALMILGGVNRLYALTISKAAIELLGTSPVHAKWDKEVPHIINRAGTGRCPVETLCAALHTPEECLKAIKDFLHTRRNS